MQDGRVIAELAGDIHFHRDAQILFQQVLAKTSGMVGGAAGHDVHHAQLIQPIPIELQLAQVDPAFTQAGADGLLERLGLLHHFLHHEVLISALFGGGYIPGHVEYFFVNRLAVAVVKADIVPGQQRDLAVFHQVDVTGQA